MIQNEQFNINDYSAVINRFPELEQVVKKSSREIRNIIKNNPDKSFLKNPPKDPSSLQMRLKIEDAIVYEKLEKVKQKLENERNALIRALDTQKSRSLNK